MITTGATLSYGLSSAPDASWGTSPTAVPPSYAAGRLPAVGFTTPGGTVSMPAGQTMTVQLGVQPAQVGTTNVQWSARGTGLMTSPSDGAFAVPIMFGLVGWRFMRHPDRNAALPPAESTKPTIPAMPSMTSPTPIGRQSMNAPVPAASDSAASVVIPQAPAPVAAPTAAADITGTIPQVSTNPAPANRKLALIQIQPEEKLPDGIGGPVLRTAALKGDPSAAYEVGVRFAEGKGVPANYDEAAKWYDRAAQAGLVPAIFRLGTLYEKGLSVKKDIDIARRYYLQAA